MQERGPFRRWSSPEVSLRDSLVKNLARVMKKAIVVGLIISGN
jgi:hypothetical protein